MADQRCEAGCMAFDGGEKKHHRDCVHYPESLTKLWHDTEAELRGEINRRDNVLGQLMNERINKHESGGGASAQGSLSAELRVVWAEYCIRVYVDKPKDTTL